MTIKEMHIGLDLALQKLNSNVFNRLLKEEKDYFLNVTTQELVRASLLQENNTVFNILTYADIRSYYEALQYYIRKIELNLNNNSGFPFVYGSLPINIRMGVMTEGFLHSGITYKIITPGTTDFLPAGGPAAANAGDVFECNPPKIITEGLLVIGETYRIINADGQSFIDYGADSNIPGTVFTSNANIQLGVHPSLHVEVLTVALDGADNTEVTPTSNFGYFNYLSSRSAIRYGQAISSGGLTVGKKYYVYKSGTTNLTTSGGKVSNDVGFIFTCTRGFGNTSSTITPVWEGGTILYEVIQPVNRIVKYQDIYNFLDHSYGTTSSSPIAAIAGNRLEVYHNYKFDVNRIYLDYVKEPVSVNFENNIDSDLPVSLHSALINTTAQYIQRTMQSNSERQQPQQQQ